MRERDWAAIPGVLRNISTPAIETLQGAVVEVYERLFRNPLQTAMYMTASRLPNAEVDPVQDALGKKSPPVYRNLV